MHITFIWILEFVILFNEILGLGEFYDILTTIFKRSTRPLSPPQLEVATNFYGDSPIFRKVRIDERAKIGTKKWCTAYVSGLTINTGSNIQDDVLIHELVHTIQYQRYGLRYMTRAVYGQNWGGGYDYGGQQGILAWQQSQNDAYFFNPEQEAEFITDLFLLSQKKPTGYFGRDLATTNQALRPRQILNLEQLT